MYIWLAINLPAKQMRAIGLNNGKSGLFYCSRIFCYSFLVNRNIYDERELLMLVAGGDKLAFQQLFSDCWAQVYGTCLHLTKSPEESKDLAQDIFLKVWENRSSLPGIHNFKGYLYIISRNLIHDHLRKITFRESQRGFLQQYFSGGENAFWQQLEQQDRIGALKAALEKLPPKLKQVFVLHRFEGFTHEQIGQIMQISPISSKAYMTRAVMALRRLLNIPA